MSVCPAVCLSVCLSVCVFVVVVVDGGCFLRTGVRLSVFAPMIGWALCIVFVATGDLRVSMSLSGKFG